MAMSPASRTLPAGLGPLAAALGPLLVFEYLVRVDPNADAVLHTPQGHFFVVSAVAALAAVVAGLVAQAGVRQRNLQVTFAGLGFMTMAALVTLHGLATPGFLAPPPTPAGYGHIGTAYLRATHGATMMPAVSEQLGVSAAALWLLLSSRPTTSQPAMLLSRWGAWLVAAWAALLGIVVLAGARNLHAADFLAPLVSTPWVWALAAATTVALVAAAVPYWRSYHYSGFPVQRAMVYAIGWFAVAQWMMLWGTVWHLSWWLHHLLHLAAVAIVVAGVLEQYTRGTSLGTALRGLLAADPVERLQAGITDSVRALVAATEMRDPYTAGHSHRVTLAALELAQAVGLPARALRALAQGGLMHDVGKIEIPDAILNKPGPLTPPERQAVQRHPVVGEGMASRLGFMREELDVIRHHHERWDGTGYPDRLRAEQIPILARILAIVDVYDALTSARSYRPPWTPERARRYVVEQAGRQFDPDLVQVWDGLVARGLYEPARSTTSVQAVPRPLATGPGTSCPKSAASLEGTPN